MVNRVVHDSKTQDWRPPVFVRVTDPESPHFRHVGRVVKVTQYGCAFVLCDGATLWFRLNQLRSIGAE